MVKQITKLTDAQAARMPQWRDRWIGIGLSCDALTEKDRRESEASVRHLYKKAGLEAPKVVIFLPSPFALRCAAGIAGGTIFATKNGFPVRSAVGNAVRNAVGSAVGNAVGNAVRNAVGNAVDSAVGNAVRSAVGNAVGNAVDSAVGNAVDSAVGNAVRSAVGNAVDSAVGNAVGNAVRSAVGNAVGNAVRNAVGAEVEFLLRCAGQAFWMEWYGGFWPGYMAWATFFRDVCDLEIEDIETFAAYEVMCSRNSGFSMHHDFAMISDRPTHIRRNAAGQLHSDAGSAIGFRDGWELFFWHGRLIPPSHTWIITHKDRINPENIELERNAELRRVMLEIFGFDRYADAREAKVVAADELHGFPRKLLEIQVNDERLRVIEVTNGSLEPDGSRRKFHLGALAGDTPHDVVAASYGIAREHYREAVRS